MVKPTLKQLGKQFNSLYMASRRFVSEHLICDIWNTDLQRVHAGKPVSVLRGIAAKKCRPSFLLGSLFSTCLDRFTIFVLIRNECVTVFIQCFCPILLCVFLRLVIFRGGRPS